MIFSGARFPALAHFVRGYSIDKTEFPLCRVSTYLRGPQPCAGICLPFHPVPLLPTLLRFPNSSKAVLIQAYPGIYAEMPVHRPRNPHERHWITDRQRGDLRAVAFQPVQRNRGTPYPCSESELRDALACNPRPRRNSSYVSAHLASHEIWAHNDLGKNLRLKEYDAIRRLESVILDVMLGNIDWGPDIIIKAFCDLDRVFFKGRLRSHVYVEWKSASSCPAPRRRSVTYGRCQPLRGGKARIRLNADAVFGGPTPW